MKWRESEDGIMVHLGGNLSSTGPLPVLCWMMELSQSSLEKRHTPSKRLQTFCYRSKYFRVVKQCTYGQLLCTVHIYNTNGSAETNDGEAEFSLSECELQHCGIFLNRRVQKL